MTPAGANRRKGQPVPAPGQNRADVAKVTNSRRPGAAHAQHPWKPDNPGASPSGQLDIEVSPKAGFINEHWIITAM